MLFIGDLLTKGDFATEPKNIPNDEKPSKQENFIPTGTPQKLNRKQRRKLQQMQNAEQAKSQMNTSISPQKVDSNQPMKTILPSDLKIPVSKGDGLLPTPPASQRLVPSTEKPLSLPDNVITRSTPKPIPVDPTPAKSVNRPPVSQPPHPVGTFKPEVSKPVNPAPIGSARPSTQALFQPPAPIQPPKSTTTTKPSQSPVSKEKTDTPVNPTPLQPPMNPVLLAQMHLQQLGIQDTPPSSSAFTSASSNVTSQTVTNSMIQQYLQQIAQTSEIESTQNMSSSTMASQGLITGSSMHLTGLLQQAPIPASSLSDGPQKSKLLQWTQPSSASNSEPTTPPSTEDEKDKFVAQKVDPVSAKWGVVAAPRLSPTPAEFKPGVPWKPRGEPDGKSDDVDEVNKENEVGTRPVEITASKASMPPQSSAVSSPSKLVQPTAVQHPASVINSNGQPTNPIGSQPLNSTGQQLNSVHQSLNSINQPQQIVSENMLSMRPPPGLNSAIANPSMNLFSGMKNRNEEPNWLILRRISSAVSRII